MTPCEKLGYKVGDEFEVVEGPHKYFRLGETINLVRDDGTDCVLFESAGGRQHHVSLHKVRRRLMPGDYCSTANMTESEYHAVAAAFMAAGCGGWPKKLNDEAEIVGWSALFGCYGWDREAVESFKRHLTPVQIIGAVNAKTEESSMQDNDGWIENTGKCPVPRGTKVDVKYRFGGVNKGVQALLEFDANGSDEIRNANDWSIDETSEDITHWRMHADSAQGKPTHIIDKLQTKRQARDVAEQQYQAALAEVREAYPWLRVEEKVEQPSEDLSDPANWRADDKVEVLKNGAGGYTFERGEVHTITIDDEGDVLVGPSRLFFTERECRRQLKWHSRP